MGGEKKSKFYCRKGLGHVHNHHECSPFWAKYPVGVGGPGIATAVIPNVDTKGEFARPYGGRYATKEIGDEYQEDFVHALLSIGG